jgi:hypothetical protein
LEAEACEAALNGGKLRSQDTSQDEISAGLQLASDARSLGQQDISAEIGAEDMESSRWPEGQAADVLLTDVYTMMNAIAACVREGDANGHWIGVDSRDGTIAKFGGGDGENAGSATNIEKRLVKGRRPQAGKLSEAKGGGGMVAGAETQTWIEHQGFLAGCGVAFDPRRQDLKCAADNDRFEMAFPEAGPVAGWQASNRDATGQSMRVGWLELREGLSDTCGDGA